MSEVKEILETMEYGPAPESPRRADEWLDGHGRAFGHFVGGAWVEGSGGETFDVVRPSDESVLARVTQGSEEDVDRAVRAAAGAQPAWQARPGHERARWLYALARRIQKHARLFAVLESMDNGKPIRESRDLDIPLVARHFYHHAGWAELMEEELPGHEALGVVGQIIPWNFPLLMLAWKIAPALATGNTVVLKPAEFTPLTALLFADLCRDSGMPDGVVNIVTGDGRTGEALVRHPGVAKIAFTGSTEVGRIIRRETAGTGKRLSLELGGKSPFVVFDDADLDSVVEGVVDAIWFNQGQVCCAGSRILVQESVAEELERKLKDRMETLRMGDPLDKGVDMGAIVAPVQLDRIRGLVEEGEAEGARVWQPSWAVPEEGWFYPPTLCTDCSPSTTLARVEIFGPVVVMMSFRTPDEAVELANDTRYGLAASVWTENVNLALDIAPAIKAGTVWVNCTNLFDAASGFGGYRESGYGREGGKEGLWEYVRPSWEKEAESVLGAGEGTADPDAEDGSADDAADAVGADADADGAEADEDAPPEDVVFSFAGEALAGQASDGEAGGSDGVPPIDRTPKMYIGGKQSRPDGDYSIPVVGPDGTRLGEVPRGNRKDVRNAVEAARKAQEGWATRTAHNRAQILYYLAENLSPRRDELVARVASLTGLGGDHTTAAAGDGAASGDRATARRGWSGADAGRDRPDAAIEVDRPDAATEVDLAIRRLFTYAAWADKWDGRVHHTPFRNVTLAMPEAIGVMGVVCPDGAPLLGLVSTLAPVIAMGNACVVVPAPDGALVATDLYQLLDTSDVPGGVVNIVTGVRGEVVPTLAAHDGVDGLWYFGPGEGIAEIERLSTGNMKRTWTGHGRRRDWFDGEQGQGEDFLREATQIKNVWVPYGE